MEQTDKKVLNKSILVLLVVVAIFVILLLVAGKKGTNIPSVADTVTKKQAIVNIGGQNLVASVADTAYARSQGLSGTTFLNNKNGMLFKFEEVDEHGIWMKNMKMPIDIIWINDQNLVVSIEENVSPDTYPKVFKPTAPAKYVLEVTAGYAAMNDIKVGDTMLSTPVIQ